MTSVYPEFADDVALVAVGFGSSETAAKLNAQKNARGYPGLFTEGPDRMVRDFGVRSQSTKLGIGSDGIVLWKKGYGVSSGGDWADRLRALADG